MRWFAWPAVGLLLLAGCCGDHGAARGGGDSLHRIAAAVERGELDPDTATLYRVYAVKDLERLPPEYRGNRPLRDGTPVLRSARERFPELPPEIQEKLKPYLFPRGAP